MNTLRKLSPFLLLALAPGCYSYVPIESGAPPLGSEFRASLTDEGSSRLSTVLGAQVAEVEGRVSSSNDTAYVVAVSATRSRAHVQTFWTGESVTIPRSSVQRIEARTLNRQKTWLIVAAGLVGGFLTAKVFGLGGSASGEGPGGGPPPP
jgi:hypothetical protein